MIKLDNYIKECIIGAYKTPDSNSYGTLEEFKEINNITECTDEEISKYFWWYSNFCHNKFVYENLTSYNTDKLVNKLNKEFKDYISNIEYDKNVPKGTVRLILKDDSFIICVSKVNGYYKPKKYGDIEKLNDILVFYGYYITYVGYNNKEYEMFIEPKTTKNVFNILKKYKYLYHVTSAKNKDYILKRGLIPKAGKFPHENGYRYFPEKIFLVSGNPNTLVNNIKEIIKTKEIKDDYIILKINITGHNIGLYIDSAYDNDEIVYTYEPIPAKIIEIKNSIEEL